MTAGNGKACRKCSTSQWDNAGHCVACKNERKRRWYAANAEKERERVRRWNAANPERKRESGRQWAIANPDKVHESVRRWRQANPEKPYEAARRWREDNPESCRAQKQTRRARKAKTGGSFTAKEWKTLCKQYDNHCCYPGCERTDLHADHVIPVSKGGTSDISNIQPLCEHHNKSKGAKVADYRHKPGIVAWIQRKLFG